MKFPKTLYVKISDDGSGNEYLDPHISTSTLVDAGERTKSSLGTPIQLIKAFGGKEQFVAAVHEMQSALYQETA